jgi:hypothetical protein
VLWNLVENGEKIHKKICHFNISKYCQQLIVIVLGKLPYVTWLCCLDYHVVVTMSKQLHKDCSNYIHHRNHLTSKCRTSNRGISLSIDAPFCHLIFR